MPVQIDIEIDKLTNSIENRITGEVFNTSISIFKLTESAKIKKKDWLFDWKKELIKPGCQVYYLTIPAQKNVIQGLVSLEDKGDHLFLPLIESAKFNKGSAKVYLGVPGNLVAFACKLSFEKGYNGYLGFFAKTVLIAHYKETLKAQLVYGNYMAIDTVAARILVNKYFNKQDLWNEEATL